MATRFTAVVRRGLVWIETTVTPIVNAQMVATPKLLTAPQRADIAAALQWIRENNVEKVSTAKEET